MSFKSAARPATASEPGEAGLVAVDQAMERSETAGDEAAIANPKNTHNLGSLDCQGLILAPK